MSRRSRRNHSPAFKAKVAVASLKGDWRHCLVLAVLRSYQPRPISGRDLDLMQRNDPRYLECPFAGGGMLQNMHWQQGIDVGHR